PSRHRRTTCTPRQASTAPASSPPCSTRSAAPSRAPSQAATSHASSRASSMKIAMIGAGYVGLVTGACFAEFGHDVTCIDSAPDRVASLTRGEIPIYEPGLEALIKKGESAGRLSFTGDLAAGVAGAAAVFIA